MEFKKEVSIRKSGSQTKATSLDFIGCLTVWFSLLALVFLGVASGFIVFWLLNAMYYAMF